MSWTYEDFKRAILELTGIDLSNYKEKQMKRRIDSLISRNGYDGYQAYYRALVEDKEKLVRFLSYITINVSEFFRNPSQWAVLEKEIIPDLLKKHGDIKIWSAACSTGEEPYSLVMLLTKFLPLERIRILATDIDQEALNKAREGIYDARSLQAVPQEWVDKYFKPLNGLSAIDSRIKACVDFKRHDLLKDPFPDNCHLILCRNVMIYFTEEAKVKVYKKLHDALHPDGVLFVGSTEQIIIPQRYKFQPLKPFFYKRM
ncbi:protein-glutamate O-methyltransferase CheR [Caldicoprobacter algeriensis]|uniref:CheR family methyltransferase n=1 Tax=Caldicoprobacter algeriensis TaxID=699281 RepID=UPI00207ABBA4|nr:protein-glutamate O-methyltransferase CheR [Caldicoprobacter algeriensis]MCM8900843.1 protein-glutamate O-methyltransferase CheR [Caldicoprobacter algeriensis]